MFFERFTEKARTAVVLAQQQARERGDDTIDTGHLLRALFAVPDNLAVMVLEGFSVRRADVEADLDRRRPSEVTGGTSDASSLAALGIDLDEVRRRVEEAFGPGALERVRRPRGRRWGGHIPFAKESKKALELALREAIAPRAQLHRHRAHAAGDAARRRSRARRAGGARGAAGRRAGDRRGAGAGPPRGVRGAPCEHRRRAHRRRHDLPGLPRAPARGAARPRAGAQVDRPRRPRPARLDPRRAPGRRRRPLRRRPRHGDAAAGVGRGARRRRRRRCAPAAAGRAHPGRPAVHAGHRPDVGGRAAAGVRVRPVRGHRPARRRRGGGPDAGRRGEHRRLRARRRRGGRAGDGRGGRPVAARSAGQPRLGRPGLLLRRSARGPVLHAAGGLAGPRRSGGAAQRQPRRDRAVAPRPRAGADGGPAARAARRAARGRARRRGPGAARRPDACLQGEQRSEG